jgi:hypothetical protein
MIEMFSGKRYPLIFGALFVIVIIVIIVVLVKSQSNKESFWGGSQAASWKHQMQLSELAKRKQEERKMKESKKGKVEDMKSIAEAGRNKIQDIDSEINELVSETDDVSKNLKSDELALSAAIKTEKISPEIGADQVEQYGERVRGAKELIGINNNKIRRLSKEKKEMKQYLDEVNTALESYGVSSESFSGNLYTNRRGDFDASFLETNVPRPLNKHRRNIVGHDYKYDSKPSNIIPDKGEVSFKTDDITFTDENAIQKQESYYTRDNVVMPQLQSTMPPPQRRISRRN